MNPMRTYEIMMQTYYGMLAAATNLKTNAEVMKGGIERQLGLEWVPREPGFPEWTIHGVPGYFPSPQAAIAAKIGGQP